jgi:(2Fe-2S) ferredoxin
MARIAELVDRYDGVDRAVFAFSEQGRPSLRDALHDLLDGGYDTITILPLALPIEPGFRVWLTKSLKRWQHESGRSWPRMTMARDIGSSGLLPEVLAGLLSEEPEPLVPIRPEAVKEGSLVPPQKRRVLVCEGGPCNSAGADALWGHLRNEQERLKLRVAGDGTMTCKTTCLGPCNLAPVLQVWPEGTFYGGVTEAAIDRIVSEHLLGGRVVEDFAYAPTGRKQRLRSADPVSNTEGD